ncbi:MAG TPA: hypothetical protein DHK64_08645, partial [Rhodobiaceae bacterium]|nr:hypothetical protein [Rhodobiaceae bacterium]
MAEERRRKNSSMSAFFMGVGMKSRFAHNLACVARPYCRLAGRALFLSAMSTALPDPAPLAPPLHFNAMITPHRSLSSRGFVILIGIVATVNFTAGILFMVQGAWPVFGFCGLEVVLVWWAFRANYRAARAHETVQLSDEELRVRRVDRKGNARAFSFQPYWVRVALR